MGANQDEAQEAPSKEPIDEIIFCGYQASVLRAALELKLWDHLSTTPISSVDLARSTGWDPEGLRRLLDVLCAMDLLQKNSNGYCLNPLAEAYLTSHSPTYAGHSTLLELGWEDHGRLAETIRTGRRPLKYDYTSPELTSIWVEDTAGKRLNPFAYLDKFKALWDQLELPSFAKMNLLDVGCGPAIASLSLAYRFPGVQVTLLDNREMLAAAHQIARTLGVAERVGDICGDIRTADLPPEKFDVVWAGNILHFFGFSENVELLEKLRRALQPGGRLVIYALHPDEECYRPEFSLMAALWLFATSKNGDAYTFQRYREMLESSGYIEIVEINQELITAIK